MSSSKSSDSSPGQELLARTKAKGLGRGDSADRLAMDRLRMACRACVLSGAEASNTAYTGAEASNTAYSLPSPTPSPTDPVPRGLLTLWARAGMCVCIYESYTQNAWSACGQGTL